MFAAHAGWQAWSAFPDDRAAVRIPANRDRVQSELQNPSGVAGTWLPELDFTSRWVLGSHDTDGPHQARSDEVEVLLSKCLFLVSARS